MYTKLLLLGIIIIFLPSIVEAQSLKIENGILFSTFDNKNKLPILSTRAVSNYSVFMGYDFVPKKWYYFSSRIGFLIVGGRETNAFLQGNNADIIEQKHMLHINSNFRVYKVINDFNVYAGVGPFVNLLLGENNFSNELYNPDYQYNKINFGANLVGGIDKEVNVFRIGLSGGYNLGLTPTATSKYINLTNNNYFLSVSLGCRFRTK